MDYNDLNPDAECYNFARELYGPEDPIYCEQLQYCSTFESADMDYCGEREYMIECDDARLTDYGVVNVNDLGQFEVDPYQLTLQGIDETIVASCHICAFFKDYCPSTFEGAGPWAEADFHVMIGFGLDF